MAKKGKSVQDTANVAASAARTPVPVTTQRAYTLRLRGVNDDTAWRDALWATHEAINRGAKAFGDWLLTLRGGLSHELAEPPPPAKGKKRTDEDTAAIRKTRRILLALSWLSVEDERGAPTGTSRVATGRDTDAERRDKVLAALHEVLSDRRVGKKEIGSWLSDCADSLAAKIREDAVWVNRSACFDERSALFKGLCHEYATESVLSFFGPTEDYFALPDADTKDAGPGGGGGDGPEFRTLARQWASTNFGTGEKSDTDSIVNGLRKLADADLSRFAGLSKAEMIAQMSKTLDGLTPDIDGLRVAVGWKTGRFSKGRLAIETLPNRLTKDAIGTMQAKFGEEADSKESGSGLRNVPKWIPDFRARVEKACDVPFVGERDHIGEFSVMLDHAARRVSIGHSWIKRAEAERQRFEEDAKRLDDVPTGAAAWLDEFITERSGTSGATAAGGEYRIRRRAIEGWDEVVKRWMRAACRTAEDRIAAAREVQSDPDIDKFGDIQVFEALAADDAECVWRADGKADPKPLRDYVLAHDAKDKQRRFKVPAYRHPDPLRHPVFGDFGNSRWEIEYAVHEAAKVAGAKRAQNPKRAAWLKDRHGLQMGLWDGSSMREVPLRWSSKRLAKDLALNSAGTDEAVRDVTRADRLGRAASGLTADETPSAAGLFALADWNGRLQAPRAQLDALAERVDKHKWDATAKAMRDRLEWLVSFSAKLECRGPYFDYAARFDDEAPAKPFVSRRGELAVKHETNEDRQVHAKLILSRLPDLRVLSVDLGHRFAASCAVWEVLSLAAFKREIAGQTIAAGGSGQNDRFCHVSVPTDKIVKSGRNKGMPVVETTIYRRIGPDKLSGGGQDHPAPWARLDRQFLVKLQGEDVPVRAASNGKLNDGTPGGPNEVGMVAEFAQKLGLLRDDEESANGRAVDQLMRRAVRIATLGLKRHARVAKIAYALNPECPGIPGMGGAMKTITRGDAEHIKFLTNALFDWHSLAVDAEWDGTKARELWNAHIKPLSGVGFVIPDPKPIDPNAERPTRQQKRKQDDTFRTERIEPIAKALAAKPASSTATMFRGWKSVWEQADGPERQSLSDTDKSDFSHTPVQNAEGKIIGSRTMPKPGKEAASGWHAHLRLLTDWIMGRRLPGATSPLWTRNVGGLGQTRITTMKSLYQLHKAFDMRARPHKVQGAPKRGEDNSGIAQGILDAMEKLREQRVKQIASRIAEAALGVGRHPHPAKGEHRDRKRPTVQTDPPCHAVVIENLRNYRPDELQTRRVNEQLMSWSSGKVRKYLEEACQLHGLHLREVQPKYTSRQCSRTGLPGMRCVDVSVKDFLNSRYWTKVVNAAKGTDALDIMLRDLHAKWSKETNPETIKRSTVRIPKQGGDLFVAATDKHGHGSGSRAIEATQADLNAAANIGLRALLDPDFAGKWWYVPCDSATAKPAADKCKGAACLSLDSPLPGMIARESTAGSRKKAKSETKSGGIINAWRDVSAEDPSSGDWMTHGEYWAKVKYRVVKRLRAFNGLDP
jgi:IS605 OrfB family transposase